MELFEPMDNKEYRGRYPEPWWISKRTGFALTYRFLLGRPMTNVVFTNASFWRSATSGYPSRWLRLAGWQRLVIRLTGAWCSLLTVLLTGLWLLGAHSFVLTVLTYQLALIAVVSGPPLTYVLIRSRGLKLPLPVDGIKGWRSVEVITGRKTWERRYVIPLGRSLAAMLTQPGQHPYDIRRWVSVPRSFMNENGEPVRIELPAGYIGQDKARTTVVKVASERLGMSEMIAHWNFDGERAHLLLSAPPAIPTKVLLADVAAELAHPQEYRPILGMVSTAKVLRAEMVDDSPHIGLSGGPGSGKSVLASWIAAQVLSWGWGVVVLDWKMTKAYKWLRKLPGVTYLTDIEAIHDAGVRIGQEVDLRKTQGMSGRANVLVLRDEWNATSDLLAAYWTDYRAHLEPEERRTTPVKSPALRGFMALDFAGREFGLFDFLIAQRFSARIFNGNADMRECFNIRALARYSPQTKQMLVGNRKLPKMKLDPGRWTFVAGENVAEVQVPLLSDEELTALALSGQENPRTPFSSEHRPGVDAADAASSDMAATQGDQLRHDAARRNQVDARKLMDMVDALAPLGITANVLRNAARDDARGDRAFPSPFGGSPNRGYTYNFEEVKEWARRRHARNAALEQ